MCTHAKLNNTPISPVKNTERHLSRQTYGDILRGPPPNSRRERLHKTTVGACHVFLCQVLTLQNSLLKNRRTVKDKKIKTKKTLIPCNPERKCQRLVTTPLDAARHPQHLSQSQQPANRNDRFSATSPTRNDTHPAGGCSAHHMLPLRAAMGYGGSYGSFTALLLSL